MRCRRGRSGVRGLVQALLHRLDVAVDIAGHGDVAVPGELHQGCLG